MIKISQSNENIVKKLIVDEINRWSLANVKAMRNIDLSGFFKYPENDDSIIIIYINNNLAFGFNATIIEKDSGFFDTQDSKGFISYDALQTLFESGGDKGYWLNLGEVLLKKYNLKNEKSINNFINIIRSFYELVESGGKKWSNVDTDSGINGNLISSIATEVLKNNN